MRRAAALLSLLGVIGCAYYNGLYNARALVRRAESALHDGRDSVAVAAWREAAAKADTVIRRYPRSRWTDDALLLSGTAAALAGDCAHGLSRLAQYQNHPGAGSQARERVSVARGACLVKLGRHDQGLDTLRPFVSHRDATLSRIAAAWAARAAVAMARDDSAIVFASIARSDALDRELVSSALRSREWRLAERLLRQRAREWRSLSTFVPLLLQLAHSSPAAVDSIVVLALRGRASRLERARLSLAAGAWSEQGDRKADAREHYERALELTADTSVAAEALARLCLIDVRAATTIAEAQSYLDRARRRRAHSELARADTGLRLIRRLATAVDSTGASLFLAAEVARDALRARALASALFREAARQYPRSSLAPKAVLAVADLWPDSAAALRAKVRAEYGTSPYVELLDGKPVNSALFDRDERLLRQAWARAVFIADSANVATERRRP
jgi:tetratricopeptide (TPR) repeat protein